MTRVQFPMLKNLKLEDLAFANKSNQLSGFEILLLHMYNVFLTSVCIGVEYECFVRVKHNLLLQLI